MTTAVGASRGCTARARRKRGLCCLGFLEGALTVLRTVLVEIRRRVDVRVAVAWKVAIRVMGFASPGAQQQFSGFE